MQRLITLALCLAILLCACGCFSSCSSDKPGGGGSESDNAPSTTPSTTPENTPAYVRDDAKYPLSESLALEADVKGLGIMAGDVIVEGLVYPGGGYNCSGFGENGEPLWGVIDAIGPDLYKTDLPAGCAVVKLKAAPAVINHTGMSDRLMEYFPFATPADGVKKLSTSFPSEPGMYWLRVTVETDDHPHANPDIKPVAGGEYYSTYYYLFAISVEE